MFFNFVLLTLLTTVYSTELNDTGLGERPAMHDGFFDVQLLEAAQDVLLSHDDSRGDEDEDSGSMLTYLPEMNIKEIFRLDLKDTLDALAWTDFHYNNEQYVIGFSGARLEVYRFVNKAQLVPVAQYITAPGQVLDVAVLNFHHSTCSVYIAVLTGPVKEELLLLQLKTSVDNAIVLERSKSLRIDGSFDSLRVARYVDLTILFMFKRGLIGRPFVIKVTDDEMVIVQDGAVEFSQMIDAVGFQSRDNMISVIATLDYVTVYEAVPCDNQFACVNLKSLQSIVVHAVNDLQYISQGHVSYIAFASSKSLILYKYSGKSLKLAQTLTFPGVVVKTLVLPVRSCRDDVLLMPFSKTPDNKAFHVSLLKARQNGRLVTYHEIRPAGLLTAFQDSTVAFNGMTSWTTDELNILLAARPHTRLVRILPEYRESTASPVDVLMARANTTVQELKARLQEQEAILKRAEAVLGKAASKQSESLMFSKEVVVKMLDVLEELKVSKVLQRPTADGVPVPSDKEIAFLKERVQEIKSNLSALEKVLKGAAIKNRDERLTGLTKMTGNVNFGLIDTERAVIDSAHGINMSKLVEDIIVFPEDHASGTILGHKVLFNVRAKTVDVKAVNGIYSSHLVTTLKDDDITGRTQFSGALLIRMANISNINEIPVNKIARPEITMERKVFTGRVVVEEMKTAGPVDEVSTTDLFENYVLADVDQHVQGTTTLYHINVRFINASIVDSINFEQSIKNLVRLDEPAVISGIKLFVNPIYLQQLTVDGHLDNIKTSDLFSRRLRQRITGMKSFRKMRVKNFNVSGLINDIDTKDVATLTKDEVIDSVTFVRGMRAADDIVVYGLVDGVKISELIKDEPVLNVIFRRGAKIGKVTALGEINGCKIEDLFKDAVFPDYGDNTLELQGIKTFSHFVAERIMLRSQLNGYNMFIDFMSEDYQDCEGTIKFLEPVTFKEDFISEGPVGNARHDWSSLLSTLNNSKQIFTYGTVNVTDHLEVRGLFCGVPVSRLVHRSIPQTITGNKTFVTSPQVDSCVADDITTGMLQEADFATLLNQRIALSRPDKLDGIWVLANNSVVYFLCGHLNGRNCSELGRNIMTRSTKQTITAGKKFGLLKASGQIDTRKGVNGFHLREINTNAVHLVGVSYVTADVVFEEDLEVGSVNTHGRLNGESLNEFVVQVVRLSEFPIGMRGAVFEHGFSVGNVHAGRLISVTGDEKKTLVNSGQWDCVLRTPEQDISGPYLFTTIDIRGDFYGHPKFHGLPLSVFSDSVAKVDQPNSIRCSMFFESDAHVAVLQESVPELSDLLDGICTEDLDKLDGVLKLQEGVYKIGQRTEVIFENLHAGSINELSLGSFLPHVVFVEGDYQVASKTFQDTVRTRGLVRATKASLEGPINGRKLDALFENAVYVDGTHCEAYGNLVFTDDTEASVLAAQLTNGHHFPEDFLLKENLVINQDITFETLEVHGDIQAKTVNGFDMKQELENTLTLTSPQLLTEDITLDKGVFLKDVLPRTVDGKGFGNNCILLQQDGDILSHLHFKYPIFIEENLYIEETLNRVNLSDLSDGAFWMSGYQVIRGSLLFRTVETSTEQVCQFLGSCGHTADLDEQIKIQKQVLDPLLDCTKGCHAHINHFVEERNLSLNLQARRIHAYSSGGYSSFFTWTPTAEHDSCFRTEAFDLYGGHTHRSELLPDDSKVWQIRSPSSQTYFVGSYHDVNYCFWKGNETHSDAPGVSVHVLRAGFLELLSEVPYQSAKAAEIVDIDGLYLLLLRPEGTVGVFDIGGHVAEHVEEVNVIGVDSMKLYFSDKSWHVALGRWKDTLIFRYKKNGHLELVQEIHYPGQFVEHVAHYRQHHLVLVEKNTRRRTHKIRILQTTRQMALYKIWQEIDCYPVLSVQVFRYGNKKTPYLLTLQQTAKEARRRTSLLRIYVLRGSSKFEPLPEVFLSRAAYAEAFLHDDKPYVAITGQVTRIFRGIVKGCHEVRRVCYGS